MRWNITPVHPSRSRRAVAVTAVAAGIAGALALVLPASAGSDATDPPEVFPVTVQTAFGPVEISDPPERIVALDFGAVDALLALGVDPAVVALGAEIDPDLPWLDGLVDPAIIDSSMFDGRTLNVEAIAAHEPDLIVGAWWAVDEAAYEQLSAIAPTVSAAAPGNEGWAARLDLLAETVGRGDRAAEIHAELDAAAADLAAGLPELAGLTYNYTGFSLDHGGFFWGNGTWLEAFGLVPNDNQDNAQATSAVSFENIDQLDADVWAIYLVNPGDRELLEHDQRVAALPSAAGDLVIWIDQPLANATNNAGPLSLRWALDVVAERLAAAGDDAGA